MSFGDESTIVINFHMPDDAGGGTGPPGQAAPAHPSERSFRATGPELSLRNS